PPSVLAYQRSWKRPKPASSAPPLRRTKAGASASLGKSSRCHVAPPSIVRTAWRSNSSHIVCASRNPSEETAAAVGSSHEGSASGDQVVPASLVRQMVTGATPPTPPGYVTRRKLSPQPVPPRLNAFAANPIPAASGC